MSNVLSDDKKQQVVALGRLGWSLRRIEQATSVRRETASAYLKAAGIAIRTVRGRRAPPKPASRAITDPGADSKAASQAITDFSAPPPAPKPQPSSCEPHRQIVEQALANRRNGVAIYQELVDQHGFGGSYSSVRRFVRRLRVHGVAKTFAVIHTDPGEEAQVDYGTGPMVRHPESGKYRRTRLFVLTLGFSRKCVRFLVWRSSSRTWADLHEKAFRRLGYHGATVEQEDHPNPKDWVKSLLALATEKKVKLVWCNCGLCVDERGVENQVQDQWPPNSKSIASSPSGPSCWA
jgi:transposase